MLVQSHLHTKTNKQTNNDHIPNIAARVFQYPFEGQNFGKKNYQSMV